MGLWTFYFFAKLYLHFRGFIRFDVLANFLFFAFLIVPLPKPWQEKRPAAIARQTAAAVIAVMLLWHDSWLPDPLHALRMLQQNGMPSGEYLIQFFLRFWSLREAAALIVLCILAFSLRRFRKTTVAATALLLLLPLILSAGKTGSRPAAALERYVGSFINAESIRQVRVKPPKAGDQGFDILILQICSLAWDDLRELGMEQDPFFQRFDFLFTGFNSVSTYSNPAAIRLLNGNCGQRRHADLYNGLPEDCSLMEGLRRQGYAIRYARNHNGAYGKFDVEIQRLGRLDAEPFRPTGLAAKKYMFDDSPVYDDYDLLEQWWAGRRRSGEGKVALYYSSVSLHDGSHWINDREWWKGDTREQYREALRILLADLAKFFDLLAASDRNVAVVVAGEHGRALRGNTIETPGLRDIPLPRITLVPVGIKLVGRNRGSLGKNVVIGKPSSYFALAFTLERFAEENPFLTDRFTTRAFVDSVPQTAFVAENENNLVVNSDDEYYFFGKDRRWLRLSAEALK